VADLIRDPNTINQVCCLLSAVCCLLSALCFLMSAVCCLLSSNAWSIPSVCVCPCTVCMLLLPSYRTTLTCFSHQVAVLLQTAEHYFYTLFTLCFHCCYTRWPCCCRRQCTIVTLLLHCCYTVLTLLLHQVAVLLQTAVRQPGSTAAVYDLFKDLLGVCVCVYVCVCMCVCVCE
jgi:hypothetical protein